MLGIDHASVSAIFDWISVLFRHCGDFGFHFIRYKYSINKQIIRDNYPLLEQ